MPTSPMAVAAPSPRLSHPSGQHPTLGHSALGRLHRRATFAAWRLRLKDQRGSQITDNLGLIVIGIVAIVAIGGLIAGLDTTIFTWLTKQLGLG